MIRNSLLKLLRAKPLRIAFAWVSAAGLSTVFGAAVWFGWLYWDARRPTQISVDLHQRFQTIEGWSVYPQYWSDDKVNDRFDRSFEPFVTPISEFLVDEVGINRVRVEIWSGLENPVDHWLPYYEGHAGYVEYARLRYEKVNDNDDPRSANLEGFQFSRFDHRMEKMVLPILDAVKRNGETPFVNVCYVDFKWDSTYANGPLSHADNPEEFAEFVLVFFERMRDKFGVVPDSFEIILEPENTAGWRGQNIGRALVAVRKRLAEAGFHPMLVAPSNTSMKNALSYFDELAKVPGAIEALDTFSYHRYHSPLPSQVRQIDEKARASGLKTAMLEKVGADIDTLLEDLTVANVSAWAQWALASRGRENDTGAFYLRVEDKADGTPDIVMAERTNQLSQVMRYVRRGAVRVAAASNRADKRAVAFVNEGGGATVVVRAMRGGGRVTVRGLPDGRYGLRFVGDDLAEETYPPIEVVSGDALEAILPRPGVLTFYSKEIRIAGGL